MVPIKTAMLWLLLSTLLVSGTAALALLYYNHVKDLYANDDTYRIMAIVQATPDKEALNTAYLAELLSLSIDRPSNLYRFNSKEARKKLLASPLFRNVSVKKIRPGMIYVDYELRKPIAFLVDYTNTAIDEEWVTLPFKPFFSPKRLPEVYLGVTDLCEKSPITGGTWGSTLQGQRVELAKKVYQQIMSSQISENTHLRRIDVSKAFAPSCGQRQIVVVFEEQIMSLKEQKPILINSQRILRLHAENYEEGLSNYFAMLKHLVPQVAATEEKPVVEAPPYVIDLRLPGLAYIGFQNDKGR